jgi:Uma2 family endonuclease
VAPVLAVEIAGEDEGEGALREKAGWYLRQGVRLIWLVLPDTREVLVISSDGERRLGRGERIGTTELLPGLEPEVARLFAQLDR